MFRSWVRNRQSENKYCLLDFCTNSVEDAPNILKKSGFVFLNNVIDKKKIISQFPEKKIEKLIKTPYTSSHNYQDLKGACKRGKSKTYVKAKNEYHFLDEGITDIHHLDEKYISHEIFGDILNICLRIISKSFPRLNFKDKYYFNLYVYDNVSTPRCFHRDSLRMRIKCFIPLVEVSKIEEGPLAIYPHSYKNNFNKVIEYFSNKFVKSDLGEGILDSCFTSYKKLIPLYYSPGDIVISRQDCIHGDFPAKIPFKRSTLVLNIFNN